MWSKKKWIRRRADNFHDSEIIELLNIIHKYGSIIENKSTNSTIWKEKEDAWNLITIEFNDQHSIKRTSKMLRTKYGSMKTAVKTKMANNEREKLENGSEYTVPYTATDKKIMSIMTLATSDTMQEIEQLLPDITKMNEIIHEDEDCAIEKDVTGYGNQDKFAKTHNVNKLMNNQEPDMSSDEDHTFNIGHHTDEKEFDNTLRKETKWKEKEHRLKILYNERKLELTILKNKRKEKDHALRMLRHEKKLEFYILENERKKKLHENRMQILEHQLHCMKQEM